MLFNPSYEDRLGRAAASIWLADAVTPDLFHDVMDAGTRAAFASGPARARLEALVDAGAWVDAALALLDMELPQWKLRGLYHEDGEWHCCLSQQRSLPPDLDDMAEARHEDMALAILAALLDARGRAAGSSPLAQRELHPLSDCALCCENFS
jgi:hypothetical protein